MSDSERPPAFAVTPLGREALERPVGMMLMPFDVRGGAAYMTESGPPPVTFSCAREPVGIHEHVRVFAGPDGARAECGVLVMRPDEAEAFEMLVAMSRKRGDNGT